MRMKRVRRHLGVSILTVAALVLPGCAADDGVADRADTELLPLGDGKISGGPEAGSVFSCQTRFPENAPGAFRDGEWIQGDQWDPEGKPTVDGEVDWPNAQITVAVEGSERVVTTNGLPSHPTGEFPVAPDDDAYAYDRNPNSVGEQSVLLRLPASPDKAGQPACVPMGMIGFALTGAAIYNALDARGRDAAAHEIQDSCDGHPEKNGEYHYHSLSECMGDESGASEGHSDLFGFALDGFGIYGPRDSDGHPLTNADLDACHGHTGPAKLDGRTSTVYHYHFTEEYPYTVGCFAGDPVELPGGNPSRRPS
ncbi:YHYH protein [Streptomyces xinghaiensis]|uniref:YHYH protein n=1 Tax=Streptomyces xinghaiensis TaxID=1038928 RepID=UPI002E154A96|nr:YHYH protein [Streptomyces xinghaiensis]